ncbi:transposase, partial [Chryseobacterium sp. RP-3-3]
KGDLIIYDRGFASFDFMYEHKKRDLDFVMRMRLDFNLVIKDFMAGGKHSQIVKMYPGKNTNLAGKPYDKDTFLIVRLLRIVLKGGETEILATSFEDENQYKNEIFKELYFERWKIETYYDELKNKLKIEEFSGYSNQSILQDFYAALLVSNIQSLIVEEINEELQEKKENKKYIYKVNTSLSYGFLKDRILSLLFSNTNINEPMEELKTLFRAHLIPVRPQRSNKRNIGKYRARAKPIVSKNQKDSL